MCEHSVYVPGLLKGGTVLDLGANKGNFGAAVRAECPVAVISIEANPILAEQLRHQGGRVIECSVGAASGSAEFHVAYNDEASSLRTPSGVGAHLVVKETMAVEVKSLEAILRENDIHDVACVKLDIEGAETDVLMSLGSFATQIAPQWTVEFHDDAEFKLCTAAEVDVALKCMRSAGFSILVRNWPARTNVLCLDRNALSIGLQDWFWLKLRYQYLALLWRKYLWLRDYIVWVWTRR